MEKDKTLELVLECLKPRQEYQRNKAPSSDGNNQESTRSYTVYLILGIYL